MSLPLARSSAFRLAAAAACATALTLIAASPAAAERMGAIQIASHSYHTCALLARGTVECWGSSGYGQLGADLGFAEGAVPVLVPGVTGAVQVTVGEGHSCALLSAGGVTCWGANEHGQLGDGSATASTVPVAVSGISGAVAVAAGNAHTCAVLADGTVKCWGNNANSQVGDGISPGSSALVPVRVGGIEDVTQITAGATSTCALLKGGAVKCWGSTEFVSATPRTVDGIENATQISSGGSHTCALLATGRISCWGSNKFGQLGNGKRWGSTLVSVIGLSGATQVSAGVSHTCAVLATAAVTCWGANWGHQLGREDKTPLPQPTPVRATGIQVAAGWGHTCSLRATGAIECWGNNSVGQIGTGEMDGDWARASGGRIFGMVVGIPDVPELLLSADFQWLDRWPRAGPLSAKREASFSFGLRAPWPWTVVHDHPTDPKFFRCALDSAAPIDCPSPVTFTGLPDGPHQITVTGESSTGLWEGPSLPATYKWEVDATPPALRSPAQASRKRTRRSTTYRLSTTRDASGIVAVEYATSRGAPSPNARNVRSRTKGYSRTIVFRTRSTVRWLRLKDAAGNWSRWFRG